MPTRTPTPWMTHKETEEGRSYIAPESGPAYVARSVDDANAAHIVQAVNAYPALVECVEALRLNWTHTDDSGRTFYCNCPRFSRLSDDCSKDRDEDHATGCREARHALSSLQPKES